MTARRKVSISLAQVENEIAELKAKLSEAEAVRSYLRRQVGDTSDEPSPRASTAVRSQVNWAERVDEFLGSHPDKRFSINQLAERLKSIHADLASATDPTSLLRATLNRYASEFEWQKERDGRAMLWFKVAQAID